MEGLFIGIGLILVVTYLWYVSLIKKRNSAREALSGIDVQLTKRASLVPNILKIAQKFMEHEKALLTDITALRAKVTKAYSATNPQDVQQHLQAAAELDTKMAQLMVNVENYPELKSDHTMLEAMQTYNEVEAHISAARRFYNSSVSELNTAVEIFPGSIIASVAGVKVMPFFEAKESDRAAIDAGDFLQ